MRLISSVLRQCEQISRTMSSQSCDGVGLSQVVQFLTSFAPLSLAESWDNVGLLVEPMTAVPIKKVLLTIDLTEAVMKEAVDSNANMIIAYHPPIFQPIKRITSGKWKERLLATCLEQKIAVFSPHTSWDAVSGGLTDWLASPFNLVDMEPLVPSAGKLSNSAFSHHVTVFCPRTQSQQCEHAFTSNDAEMISSSQLESHMKYRLLAKRRLLSDLETDLNQTDCYYSIYERGPVPPKGCGVGRVGKLKSPLKLSEAIDKVKSLVGMPQIRIALEKGKSLDSTVESVALVAGSGASVLRGVRADLYVTGEMLHHDLLEANHNGASVILVNHSDSERGYLTHFAPTLAQAFPNQLTVVVSKTDKDPIIIV